MALHFDERLMLSQGGMVISETDYAYNAITGRLQTITVNGTAFTVGYLANGNAVQSIGTSAVGTTWTLNTSGTSDGDLQGVITIASGTNLYAAHYTYSPEKGRRPNIDGFRCVAYLVRSCSDAPAKPPAESSFTALTAAMTAGKSWRMAPTAALGLESTFHKPGRPKKKKKDA